MSEFVQAIVAGGLFATAIVAIVFGRDFWGKGLGVEVKVEDPKK